jgi:hypothetical protein
MPGRKRTRKDESTDATGASRQRTGGTDGGGGGAAAATATKGGAGTDEAGPSSSTPLVGLLTRCFAEVDGYRIAREVRAKQRRAGVFLEGITYGEVDIGDFTRVLQTVGPVRGETFVDVGSGTGKAVLCAAACHPLRLVRGIEILPELHAAASEALGVARAEKTAGGGTLRAALADGGTEVELHCGDAFAQGEPWSAWAATADVVFATTTCFTDELHAKFGAAVAEMRVGSRLIVTTQALTSDAFVLLGEGRLRCAKGSLAYFAYRKVREGGGGAATAAAAAAASADKS